MDDDLIRRFRAGDEEAVRIVYRTYGGAVQTVVRSMIGDLDLAADAVQQTFVKAWTASATFDDTRELAPWLYTIARRTAIDAMRREGRHRAGEVDPDDHADAGTMSFERTWEIHEVRLALDRLPIEEREVVRLSHLEGRTHAEIAAALGVPLGTVKSRSARARRRLHAALGHVGDPANRTAIGTVEGGEENR